MFSSVLVLALFSGALAAFDPEMGTKLGDMDILGQRCPMWAVSHNTIHMDCQLNTAGMMFSIDDTKLTPEIVKGKTLLSLRQTYAIPYERNYKINVKQNGQMIASVEVPSNMMVPMPMVVPELSTLAYEVGSDKITILNAKTIFIPQFNYNGKGPDAFFWVGKGAKPDADGQIVPNELGSSEILGKYESKDVVLTLPEGLTVHDIDYLSVWCRAYKHDFGHVMFPESLKVPPPTYQPQVMDYSNVKFESVPGGITVLDDNHADSSYAVNHEQSFKEKESMDATDNSASSAMGSSMAVFMTVVLAVMNH